ncbi:putative caffeate O-methyltransferase [Medicago truncatula]|uniref:caffeate O-methyltransferase n=1 Tax=Medicago truncatula TaxID=3880 RepID=A0A396GKB4_MEDTR|nr:caffeic acid 3-O-methyltransferase [Medicago truncatula]RHN41569.1 putative caffeate O-methyltransferase [Medicago truncatula]
MANHSNVKDLGHVNGNGERKSEKQELEDEESFSYAIQLGSSMVLPMVLHSASQLGVFDVLQKAGKGAQLSADEIASRISCSNPDAPKMLDRILALLASHDVLKCLVIEDEQKFGSFHRLYSMTPVARFFAPNSDGVSLGPLLALIQDNVFLASWSEFNNAIREGGVPFNMVHGTHAFDYPSLDSRFNKVFNTAMINHTKIVMNKVLESYNGFEGIKRLVDVGGGLGVNIQLVTSKYPNIHGINFDLPHVIQHAPSYPGVEHVGGDMFESVPKGDAILMKWILHDWSDEHCLKILKNCYDAIPNDGKVIVLEAHIPIVPENSYASKSTSQLDVLMMTQSPGGKERTKQEFIDLATRVGFIGIRCECCVRNFWVMEFFK